jgi:hypothetical protein
MLWTPTTLLLHLLWSWQFVLACAGEVALLYGISYIVSNVLGSEPKSPGYIPSPSPTINLLNSLLIPINRWLWVFFALTLLLAIVIIAEICLYANAGLSPNLYLGLQTAKLLYAAVTFGLFLAFSSIPTNEYLWRFILGIFVYW